MDNSLEKWKVLIVNTQTAFSVIESDGCRAMSVAETFGSSALEVMSQTSLLPSMTPTVPDFGIEFTPL